MQVVQDNYNKDPTPTPPKDSWKLICEECESVLDFTKDDVSIGELGMAYIKCPLCGKDNFFGEGHRETEEPDDYFDLTLNKDNVKFPNHFFHSLPKDEDEEVFNTEIEKQVRKGIEYCRVNHIDEGFWFTMTGGYLMFVIPYGGDEDYWVVVTRDYYDVNIPFEDVDYENIHNDDCVYFAANTNNI